MFTEQLLQAVLTKTWNEPKRPETSQHKPKLFETTGNDPQKFAKRLETIQNFKIREIWNFLLTFVFQISSQNA